jgi:hypothetical protein
MQLFGRPDQIHIEMRVIDVTLIKSKSKKPFDVFYVHYFYASRDV